MATGTTDISVDRQSGIEEEQPAEIDQLRWAKTRIAISPAEPACARPILANRAGVFRGAAAARAGELRMTWLRADVRASGLVHWHRNAVDRDVADSIPWQSACCPHLPCRQSTDPILLLMISSRLTH